MALPSWFYLDFLVPLIFGVIFVLYLLAFAKRKENIFWLPVTGFGILFLESAIMSFIMYSRAELTVNAVDGLITVRILLEILGLGLILAYVIQKYFIEDKRSHKIKSSEKKHAAKRKSSKKKR
ncbi:MAG: hypothetical protein ACLFUO_02255 [Candidatus Woesearchaeota archaeon]